MNRDFHHVMRRRLLLGSIALLPITLVAGCSHQSNKTTPTSSNTPTVSQGNTTSSQKSTSNSSNTTGQTDIASGSVSASTPNDTSTNASSPPVDVTSTSTSTHQPHIVEFPPSMWALNTVHIAGRVTGGSAGESATIFAKLDGTNQIVTSTRANVQANGSFSANLSIPPSSAPQRWTFEATYPGATGAAVTRYLSSVPMSGSQPAVMVNTRNVIKNMGATFPILLPSWLPQTLSQGAPTLPAYSTTIAAKSFNYQVQVLQTAKAYAVNDKSMPLDQSNDIANISGTQFKTHQDAMKQLMWHANQALPSSSTPFTTLALNGKSDANVYTDKWHTVLWHEGDWLLVIRGPSKQQNEADAKKVASILDSVYLPPTNGVVWVRNISDGGSTGKPNTTVSFAKGTNVYTMNAQNEIYTALVMTASMKD